jgi:hypothetical protein
MAHDYANGLQASGDEITSLRLVSSPSKPEGAKSKYEAACGSQGQTGQKLAHFTWCDSHYFSQSYELQYLESWPKVIEVHP